MSDLETKYFVKSFIRFLNQQITVKESEAAERWVKK